MQCCKYAKSVGCSECNAVYYNKCKNFVLAHAASLTRNIRPFKLDSKVKVTTPVVWSRDINKAKSAACKYALKLNSDVVKLTLSQVLSIVISNQELEGKVFFIDYSTKATGDGEKIKGVLTSFIEDTLLKGACVSLYVGTAVTAFNLEYTKL